MAAAASGLLSWLVGSAPSREFTAEELYASKDEGKMYVALNGRVYDVNPRPDMYGPGAPYNKLLGRDATRALATMELIQVDLALMAEEDMDTDELKTLREWEAKYSQKYDVVGTLKPGSALQLRPAAESSSRQEPEPEPELQPGQNLAQAGAPADAMVAAAAAANRARVERLESQTVVSYYAGKSEVELIDLYGRGPRAAKVSARSPQSSPRPTPEIPAFRGGELLRIADFADAAQYEGRVGVATGRQNESTGRVGIAIPMASGAEGTLMVPAECLRRHPGPSDSNAAEHAVEFLNAGTVALKMAETAQNRTQRRAWLRRAVMWYKGLGHIMPGHPSQVAGLKRCEALAFLMNPQ